ncbi:MAG: nucleoside triphosphate pyrophosphohydrolase [Chloroflexi bacterium]|nr:nucleoside triphosphate pyrophosphohydrolase [Chloroflexota bacterium]
MTAGITIVGLGPGDPTWITRQAWQILGSASEVYLRTARHEAASSLPVGPHYTSFDELYEHNESLTDVYALIAERIVHLGQREQGVIYAVPGHPLAAETSVQLIRKMASAVPLQVHIIGGLSLMDAAVQLLEIDPYAGLQIAECANVARLNHPNLDPDVPALIMQVGNRHLAGQLKLTLMNLYPDEQPIQVITALGTRSAQVKQLQLYELDRLEAVDHLTAVYIPALAQQGSLASHQNVVARLRAPDGCPWDREQTHQSLRTHLLEETYEVLDALDADDMTRLREELGDLLLQIMLHAQIATEDGDFKLVETVQANISKLVRRHPHVFGDTVVSGSEDVLRNWEQIKRQERNDQTKSLLDGISRALPSLSQAMEIQRRVARVGFDWPNAEQVMAKVREELQEWQAAESPEHHASELGDLLFSVVNLARWFELDAESALRETNKRFAQRFSYLEQHAAQMGKAVEELDAVEMDNLWEQAKSVEEQE